MSLIDQIAAQQLGPAPGGADPMAAAAAAAPAPAAEPPKDSPTEQATQDAAPQTEADRMAADAVIYDIEFGEGDKRKLTPNQIKSTFERYAALNGKQAKYKPIMDLVERIEAAYPDAKPEQIADQLKALITAQQHNPQMGNTSGQPGGTAENPAVPPGAGQSTGERQAAASGDIEAQIKAWEEENAASLPPGYKEMLLGNRRMPEMVQQISQQVQMLQRAMQVIMAQTQGVADAARTGMERSTQNQTQAVRQQIANNIDRVQQALQLPDEAAQDFMVFAAERGFTLEDFVDLNLTAKVMQDFKATMSTPEMERLRQMAQRRQAYTGSMGSMPGAGAAAGAPAPSRIDELAQAVMSQRGMQ